MNRYWPLAIAAHVVLPVRMVMSTAAAPSTVFAAHPALVTIIR